MIVLLNNTNPFVPIFAKQIRIKITRASDGTAHAMTPVATYDFLN